MWGWVAQVVYGERFQLRDLFYHIELITLNIVNQRTAHCEYRADGIGYENG